MIETLEIEDRKDLSRSELRQRAVDAIESSGVVFLPRFPFELRQSELFLLDPATAVRSSDQARASGRPTVVYDPARAKVRGSVLGAGPRQRLLEMLRRYEAWARALVDDLLPGYGQALQTEYTTFRPIERTGEQGLHVDAVIARPTQGRCWLRVWTNVHPEGSPRVWQVGEPFEDFCRRFLPRVSGHRRVPGLGWLLDKVVHHHGRTTAYDHIMQELRRLVKDDDEYQRSAPRQRVEFPVGSTWLCFTDSVLHGALRGQYSLDQTFLLPVAGMRDPARSTLKILERLSGRPLVEPGS